MRSGHHRAVWATYAVPEPVGTFTFTDIDPVSKAEKHVTNGRFQVPF